MRKLWIATAFAALLLMMLPLSAQQATEEVPAQNAALPACADLFNANLRVENVADALETGAVYCREIVRDGDYLTNPGAIGDQSVIERGVLQAYDVFYTVAGSGATQPFTHAITICLEGRGDLLFLPVFGSPRPVLTPQTFVKGDYTCTEIGSPGIVALVNS
ncbi:MAG: hypothetical protein GC204_10690 [Chloroflexi bacterium]|nr:hypothetical protein [Chloroflexota bacterium]